MDTTIEKTEALIHATRELDAMYAGDPYRPRYHFTPPFGWMNDINGSIFWKGRYHIFYQHNPEGGYWKWMQWGHASSVDMVHWVHHPIALTPDLDGPDRGGCFSGGAFVNREGIPTFIYHGIPDGTCIATSDDDLLITWDKHPANPVIPVPAPGEKGHGDYIVYDPCAWVEGDTYYALIGNTMPGQIGDGTALFKSSNLVDWEFVRSFYQSRREWTDAEEDCAVPDFYPLGDKHMLLFCSHWQGTQYYLGRFEDEQYHVETYGRMSWEGGLLGGPRSLLDAQGRRIFLDWIREIRGTEQERASGWSGVMTVPRILSLATDGSLQIEPVPELECLRMNPKTRENITLNADDEVSLEDIHGNCLELAVEIDPGDATEVGVQVLCSPDQVEQTGILYVPAEGTLKIDISRSTLNEVIQYPRYRSAGGNERLPESERFVDAECAPFTLMDKETLHLRIYVDKSVVEVFANGRQCITQRVYPTRADSTGVRLVSRGGQAHFRSIQAWEMAPAF